MFCPGAEAVHETSETPTRGFRREFNELLPCLKFGDEILVKPLAVFRLPLSCKAVCSLIKPP